MVVAAAERPDAVGAVVSRGGRPDLAGPSLPRVLAPTLLIVGGNDGPVIDLNRTAMARMRAETVLEIAKYWLRVSGLERTAIAPACGASNNALRLLSDSMMVVAPMPLGKLPRLVCER